MDIINTDISIDIDEIIKKIIWEFTEYKSMGWAWDEIEEEDKKETIENCKKIILKNITINKKLKG